MKKRHLKRWVKAIIIIIFVVIIYNVVKSYNNYHQEQIDNCVANGHQLQYCKLHLGK